MEASANTCCVPKCGRTRAENVILHAFPNPTKDKERFLTWVNAVGSSLAALDHQHIYKNRRICHQHFEERYLTWSRRLSYGAVPTLNMPGFQVNCPVLRDITNMNVATSPVQPVPTTSLDDIGPSTSSYVGPAPKVALGGVNIPEQQLKTNSGATASNKSSKNEIKGKTYKDDKAVLIETLKKAMKKNKSYASRLKKATQLSSNTTFVNTMKKFASLAAIFIAMQFREVGKNKKARRFSEEEKIMALSLYKQGPKLYRFMKKAFVLPSPLTLSRLIARAEIKPGINEKLFKLLEKKVKNMNNDDKLCMLLFDEIAIAPHFDYNERKDFISGFTNNGEATENVVADHALVFMIRGIVKNYKQPIAYTFCSGSTKKEELEKLIKQVIRKLHSVGLNVLATVCDQGASNMSCIRKMINDTKVKYIKNKQELKADVFEVDNAEIIPLFDPPHLIKGIRNNLLDKNLKCSMNGIPKLAKWEHIILLNNENPSYGGVRLLNKLTEDHVNPEKCKMKVKFATQIFSQRVAGTMGYLAERNILPQECKETADVLLFFDELFDSVNGSKDNMEKRRGKPLLNAVTPKSLHNDVWAKAKKILSGMKFIKNSKEVSNPTVSNWLFTINNIQYLRDKLFNKYQIKSFWMRHFNQDPLENFFGIIRSHGYRNVNPTPNGFEIAFSSLLINNLTGSHSPGANCEQDSCVSMFKTMNELFKESEKNNMPPSIDFSYFSVIDENVIVDIKMKTKDPRIWGSLEYISGYILRKTNHKVFKNCSLCKNSLYNNEKSNSYLRIREFDKTKRSLHYPSEKFIEIISNVQDILSWILKKRSNIQQLKNYMKTVLYVEIDTNFITCDTHKNENIDFIFNLACRFFIYNWCKDINNIFKGRRKDSYDQDDIMKVKAVEYFRKRRKTYK